MIASPKSPSRSIGWLRSRLHPAVARDPSRGITTTAGVLGSLLLHGLLVEAALFGSGSSAPRVPREPGLGAHAIVSDEQPQATLILIDAAGTTDTAVEPRESPASPGSLQQIVRLTVISPEPVREPAFEIDAAAAGEEMNVEAASTDALGRAKQFGIYLRQIQARVERAWLRPRSPIAGDAFSCRVQVLQNRRGEVLEVTLQRCDADPSWQLSLVRAIERASPLPAPPDPIVFSESFQLSFRSAAYDPGQPDQGFEAETPVLAGGRPISLPATLDAPLPVDAPPAAPPEPKTLGM